MKIVMHSLSQIDGVEIFPIISFVIFFALFMIILYRVFSTSKSYNQMMKQMPFDNNDDFLEEENEILKH